MVAAPRRSDSDLSKASLQYDTSSGQVYSEAVVSAKVGRNRRESYPTSLCLKRPQLRERISSAGECVPRRRFRCDRCARTKWQQVSTMKWNRAGRLCQPRGGRNPNQTVGMEKSTSVSPVIRRMVSRNCRRSLRTCSTYQIHHD